MAGIGEVQVLALVAQTPHRSVVAATSVATADGGRCPNLGETKLRFLTPEHHRCEMVFQVADIKKPILSVGALTASGAFGDC